MIDKIKEKIDLRYLIIGGIVGIILGFSFQNFIAGLPDESTLVENPLVSVLIFFLLSLPMRLFDSSIVLGLFWIALFGFLFGALIGLLINLAVVKYKQRKK